MMQKCAAPSMYPSVVPPTWTGKPKEKQIPGANIATARARSSEDGAKSRNRVKTRRGKGEKKK